MVIIAGHVIVDAKDRDRYVDAHRDLVERARSFDDRIQVAIAADSIDPAGDNNLEVGESAEALDSWRAQPNAPDHAIEFLGMAVQRYNATEGGPLL